MQTRYNQITKEILSTIAVPGMVVVDATSPYFLINLAKAILKNRKYAKSKENEQKIVRSLRRLRKSNLIILKDRGDDNFTVQLTQKGKKKVEEVNFEKLEIVKPAKWDGKWRLITFDIPENRKAARDALRFKMKELKFYQLQKSVFVCPYPCEKEILFLCEFFYITRFVNIIVADSIYDDVRLMHHFNIK